jgi:3-oxoacyl-[acyl-carrier protein] reductase
MKGTVENPNGPVVLITGAAGGLGRALVSEFVRNRWSVVAAAHKVESWDGTSPDEGREDSGILWKTSLDVTDRGACQAVVKAAVERFGRIDCLINNAGIAADGSVARLTDDDWQRVLDVNLKGAFFCSQAVARTMASARSGHILNIASWAARHGTRGQVNYAAAKAGLIGLTQSLARELGSRNVRVNVVLPGVLPTRMTGALTAQQLDDLSAANVLGRTGSLEEVARFIGVLAGLQHVSGQLFQLDSRIASWT